MNIFEGNTSFDLYQTGLIENIQTQKYAYDNLDLVSQVLNRYTVAITLGQLVQTFPEETWQWTGTGTANGRLYIKHSDLNAIYIDALGWSDADLKIEDKPEGLTFRSISSTN